MSAPGQGAPQVTAARDGVAALRDNVAHVIRAAVPAAVCADFRRHVEESADVPDARGYRERTGDGSVRLCRVERFTEVYPSAGDLLDAAHLIAAAAFGAAAVLMKDKLNIKYPGGGGYRCHQDSQAYPAWMAPVLTVGFAVSACDVTRGGLFFATGVDRLLLVDDRGCVTPAEQRLLAFDCPELAVGDAVAFSGYVPHYSGANSATVPRMLALLTFAPRPHGARSDGELRDEYYRWREERIRASGANRLSTIDDFSGTLVDF
jgi:ectoine hydroxylase-related dioxygenase (phytanoyl-CoA dioxygenase family)